MLPTHNVPGHRLHAPTRTSLGRPWNPINWRRSAPGVASCRKPALHKLPHPER